MKNFIISILTVVIVIMVLIIKDQNNIPTIIEQPSPIKYDYKGIYELTWYCQGNVTASGNKVNHNTTASADVRGGNFNFNDIVYIEYLQKPVVIHDTGSAIKGNKIDIYVNDCDKAIQEGRKMSKVYLIGGTNG